MGDERFCDAMAAVFEGVCVTWLTALAGFVNGKRRESQEVSLEQQRNRARLVRYGMTACAFGQKHKSARENKRHQPCGWYRCTYGTFVSIKC